MNGVPSHAMTPLLHLHNLHVTYILERVEYIHFPSSVGNYRRCLECLARIGRYQLAPLDPTLQYFSPDDRNLLQSCCLFPYLVLYTYRLVRGTRLRPQSRCSCRHCY